MQQWRAVRSKERGQVSLGESLRALAQQAPAMFEEMGDLLFSIVNLSRFMGIQPEDALRATCRKFAERFRHIERRADEQGRSLDDMTLEEMDALWEEAKTAAGRGGGQSSGTQST